MENPREKVREHGQHLQMDYQPSPSSTYIAFNKPVNVLSEFTTPRAPELRALGDYDLPATVHPLARLEADSEGLLILSDDGRLNRALLNPAFSDKRVYLVQVQNIPTQEALERLQKGVEIEDKITAPAAVELLPHDPDIEPPPTHQEDGDTCWLRLTMTEGRNRQVRKMTAAVGCPALRLIRTAIGKLNLTDLKLATGKWRKLSADELLLALTS